MLSSEVTLRKVPKKWKQTLTSLGFLWLAQRKIHCSVAVICRHTVGSHSSCRRNTFR